MPYENLQYLEQHPQNNLNSLQTLVLSTYLEERKKWIDQLNTIKLKRSNYIKDIVKLQAQISIEELTSLVKAKENLKIENNFWAKLCKFFNLKTKAQRKLDIILNKINKMKYKTNDIMTKAKELEDIYKKMYLNPPNIDRYELAIMGNNLFKLK